MDLNLSLQASDQNTSSTKETKINFQLEIEIFGQEMELFFQILGLWSKYLF